MKQQIKVLITGHVSVRSTNPLKNFNIHNAVQAIAPAVMARNLANEAGFELSAIRVYNGVTLLSNKALVSKAFVADATVQCIADFAEADFSGNFTKIELLNANGDIFSIVDSLTENKSGGEEIQITWSLNLSI